MKKFIIVLLFAFLIALFVVHHVCENCEGTGRVPGEKTVQVPCARCEGTGRTKWQLKKKARGKAASQQTASTCVFCEGKGYKERASVRKVDCPKCKGSGKIKLYRSLENVIRGKIATSKDSSSEESE